MDRSTATGARALIDRAELTAEQREMLADLFAIVEEHAEQTAVPIDRDRVEDAFVFACVHHADQRRKSGEEFITHPVGVAKICAGLRMDTETLCAALLHDTVEDTSASLQEITALFGEEITGLVDGVTKLTGLTFQSRDEAQAENYRKMMVAMSSDIRVILIKLADRLHNMRTIAAMAKQKQIEKSRETLDIYAPIAHRLGIHAIKWELEDLAFQTLHPRKYNEIKSLVAQQRDDREGYVSQAGEFVARELGALGIHAEISGRAKHFYSIYAKMTKKGREFNEIYDLTAMRVIVDSVKDCYGAVGVIHSLWKPLPGRFKDFIAMPKFNMYASLHTTVIGPEGRPLEIQIRTREMHDLAEFGIAAHWMYKESFPGSDQKARSLRDTDGKLKWLRSLMDWQQDTTDPREFMETLKVDLFEDEVFVFTPKGEVKSLAAGATPLDFAYEIHTDVGHRCVGAKVTVEHQRTLQEITPVRREITGLVDGVTKLTSADLPVARRGPGRELPQDGRRDVLGHPRDPDQARRSPPQHAHDRRDAQAEADREVARDARHLRPDRPPARHPRDQVGARGPRLPDPAPAQVQRDQGARGPAARRSRGLRQPGRRVRRARSWARSGSTPRSPAAPSTSTRSTPR